MTKVDVHCCKQEYQNHEILIIERDKLYLKRITQNQWIMNISLIQALWIVIWSNLRCWINSFSLIKHLIGSV